MTILFFQAFGHLFHPERYYDITILIATGLHRQMTEEEMEEQYGKEFYHTRKYNIHLVDRGGGGASFSAGLIYSLLNGFDLEKTGEFAVAASALKQTIVGDFNLATLDEVEQLMNGNASGRVQR